MRGNSIMEEQYIGWSVLDFTKEQRAGVVPARIIRYLSKRGLIADPLDQRSLVCLVFLEKIWRRQVILQGMMAGVDKQRRNRLVETADLTQQWEKFAYSLFRKRAVSPRNFKDITIPKVASQVREFFGFALYPAQYARLQVIKKKATDAVRYKRKKGFIEPLGKY